MLDTISIFLNLLRFDLWPKMWSILGDIPCALEKKEYSSIYLLYLHGMSWRYQWYRYGLMCYLRLVFLLIFCFDDLSIGVRGMLKSHTIIVLLSNSPFMSVSVCLMYWGAPMLGASDQISRSIMSDSLRPHELQRDRPPCPSPTPGVHWDSHPLSQWCHPAISEEDITIVNIYDPT